MPVRVRVAGALLAGFAVLAGACGGGTQSRPETLGSDDVPFGLLDEPTSSVPTTTAPARNYPFVVYFVGPDGPVPVLRTASSAPDPSDVARALLAGPTREEVQVGMNTSIPPRAINRVGRVSQRTVTIDLDPRFVEVSGPAQTRALTQIVLTMTALREVARVRFLLDGEPVSVPRLDGTVTRGSVRRGDYLPDN
jgi:spore germination protein GerM